jgi:hypothetical protein
MQRPDEYVKPLFLLTHRPSLENNMDLPTGPEAATVLADTATRLITELDTLCLNKAFCLELVRTGTSVGRHMVLRLDPVAWFDHEFANDPDRAFSRACSFVDYCNTTGSTTTVLVTSSPVKEVCKFSDCMYQKPRSRNTGVYRPPPQIQADAQFEFPRYPQ